MNDSPTPPRFLHVDINAYFATMLQQENPHLRGKPIGVVKELRRTCVIAASKEAKLLGVRTGSSAREAKILAPTIIFVPAAFSLYLSATKTLYQLFQTIAPRVEIYSLDEAFIEITDCARLYPDPHALGKHIQQRIKEALGEWVTCNVGIGATRFLAKLASETAPKGSVVEITNDNRNAIFASAKFEEVCGIGRRLAHKLSAIGVTNLLLLDMCSDEEIQRQVGPFWTRELRRMTSGEETHLLSFIDRNPHMQSVGRSITGYAPCSDERAIARILYNLIEETTYKCRTMGLAGRQVWIGLWGSGRHRAAHRRDDFWSAHQTLKYSINTPSEMFEIAYTKLYSSWHRSFPVIKFGVRLNLLSPNNAVAIPLFTRERKAARVMAAVDRVNTKYGLFTVRSGLLANVPIIRPEVTGFLGDKKFQLET